MPTHQDQLIFVTGVVGRSMGSGKFTLEQIRQLTVEAQATFIEVFGDPNAPPPAQLAAQHAELSARARSAPPEPAKSYGAPVPPTAKEPGPAEGKDFRIWANDKLRIGKKPGPGGKPWGEVTWAEAHQHLAGGSAQVAGYLRFICNLKDDNPQYAKANGTLRARAQAVLDSCSTEYAESTDTPF